MCSSDDKGVALAEERLVRCFRFLLDHDGSGKLNVSTKILKRGQKEILIECGRVYRYVVGGTESSE